ncbi:MAG: LysR family transcriptional regulator [Hyphomicrobiaceae bacterium]
MLAASVRRLDVFKAVVEHQGVNAAAEFLAIAQPSVTAHIKALENQIGAPLFERQRGRRHLRPTPAGDELYRYACEMIAKSREINATLRRTQAASEQRLMIAAQRVIANNLLPAVLADFLSRHSGTNASVHSETQEVVRALFRSGEADAALLFARKKPEDTAAQLIGSLDLAFIAAPDHPLAKRKSIDAAELVSYPFVGGLSESEFFRLILEEMSDTGLQGCRFILHLQDSIAVKHAVMRNVGLACTFRLAVEEDVARGELVLLPVSGRGPRLPIYCLHRAPGAMTKLSEAFIAQVRSSMKKITKPDV